MYKGENKTVVTDNFILKHIKVNEQMNASKFEGLLHKILSK